MGASSDSGYHIGHHRSDLYVVVQLVVKLTDGDVKDIRKCLGYGVRPKKIAKTYGVSVAHVNRIKNGNRRGPVDEQKWP